MSYTLESRKVYKTDHPLRGPRWSHVSIFPVTNGWAQSLSAVMKDRSSTLKVRKGRPTLAQRQKSPGRIDLHFDIPGDRDEAVVSVSSLIKTDP